MSTQINRSEYKLASDEIQRRFIVAFEALKNYLEELPKLDKIIQIQSPIFLQLIMKDKDNFTIALRDFINEFISVDEKEILAKSKLIILSAMALIDKKPLERLSMEIDKSGVIAWFKRKVAEWYLKEELSETTVELTLGHEKLEELEFKKHLRKKYAGK